MDEFYTAAALLPQTVSAYLLRTPNKTAENVTEIRLRANRELILTLKNGFTAVPVSEKNNAPLTIGQTEIKDIFSALCGYSVYSLENSINSGFIPLAFGHRAGVCGTGYYTERGFAVKDITSINIRVARNTAVKCPPELESVIMQQPSGLLIAGAPASGKTTLLKAIINSLSRYKLRTSVIDERGELCPISKTSPLHCDVFSAYPKAVGMLQAIRSMSPQVIVCDEIGGFDDARAVISAANAGVGMIMSVHAQNISQLFARPQTKAVLNTGAFNTVCFLKGAHSPCEIERIENICLP